jgi:hypothetical protein
MSKWVPVSHNPAYEVSSLGAVRNAKTKRHLKARPHNGRLSVQLSVGEDVKRGKDYTLAVLVWEAFAGLIPKAACIKYRDGDPFSPSACRLANLYLGPAAHSFDTFDQIWEIKEAYQNRGPNDYGLVTQLAKEHGVSTACIVQIGQGKYYPYVKGPGYASTPEIVQAEVERQRQAAEEAERERWDTIAGVEVDREAAAYFAT